MHLAETLEMMRTSLTEARRSFRKGGCGWGAVVGVCTMKMTPEVWQLVCAALERADDLSEEVRAVYLEQLRRHDPHVASEVEALEGIDR